MTTVDHDVGIIGAGVSGIAMAIALQKEGKRSFVLFERHADVGGTWLENTYPGCACDVPSHMYSYSFALHSEWTRAYAPQPEILAYVKGVVSRFGLTPHIRFSTRVERVVHEDGVWRIDTPSGPVRVRQVVFAAGFLNVPRTPAFPGADTFEGDAFHSARWRHDLDLRGKRVAVIGTGASAIQFVPRLAPEVAALHVFQRTPPWILPRRDRAIGPVQRWLMRRVPGLQRAGRSLLYALLDVRGVAFTVRPAFMKRVAQVARAHIRSQIPDAALRDAVTPRYTPGCKRILLADDYYPALCRDNVELVTAGVKAIEPGAIVDDAGVRRPVDVIVYGTGFAVADVMARTPVIGPDGASLQKAWKEGRTEAYLGTLAEGFPNLFMLMGPNTGLGHHSMIFMIESQVHFIMQLLREADARGAEQVFVRPGALRHFNDRLQARLASTVWASGCASWYLDERGFNATLWPGSTTEFWLRTRRVEPRHIAFA